MGAVASYGCHEDVREIVFRSTTGRCGHTDFHNCRMARVLIIVEPYFDAVWMIFETDVAHTRAVAAIRARGEVGIRCPPDSWGRRT